MGDWILDNFGWFLVAFAVVIIALGVMAGNASMRDRMAFMEDCMKDRKEYECTAMWRAGQPSVVPMPIVIPVR